MAAKAGDTLALPEIKQQEQHSPTERLPVLTRYNTSNHHPDESNFPCRVCKLRIVTGRYIDSTHRMLQRGFLSNSHVSKALDRLHMKQKLADGRAGCQITGVRTYRRCQEHKAPCEKKSPSTQIPLPQQSMQTAYLHNNTHGSARGTRPTAGDHTKPAPTYLVLCSYVFSCCQR